MAESERLEVKEKVPLVLVELLLTDKVLAQAKDHRILLLSVSTYFLIEVNLYQRLKVEHRERQSFGELSPPSSGQLRSLLRVSTVGHMTDVIVM